MGSHIAGLLLHAASAADLAALPPAALAALAGGASLALEAGTATLAFAFRPSPHARAVHARVASEFAPLLHHQFAVCGLLDVCAALEASGAARRAAPLRPSPAAIMDLLGAMVPLLLARERERARAPGGAPAEDGAGAMIGRPGPQAHATELVHLHFLLMATARGAEGGSQSPLAPAARSGLRRDACGLLACALRGLAPARGLQAEPYCRRAFVKGLEALYLVLYSNVDPERVAWEDFVHSQCGATVAVLAQGEAPAEGLVPLQYIALRLPVRALAALVEYSPARVPLALARAAQAALAAAMLAADAAEPPRRFRGAGRVLGASPHVPPPWEEGASPQDAEPVWADQMELLCAVEMAARLLAAPPPGLPPESAEALAELAMRGALSFLHTPPAADPDAGLAATADLATSLAKLAGAAAAAGAPSAPAVTRQAMVPALWGVCRATSTYHYASCAAARRRDGEGRAPGVPHNRRYHAFVVRLLGALPPALALPADPDGDQEACAATCTAVLAHITGGLLAANQWHVDAVRRQGGFELLAAHVAATFDYVSIPPPSLPPRCRRPASPSAPNTAPHLGTRPLAPAAAAAAAAPCAARRSPAAAAALRAGRARGHASGGGSAGVATSGAQHGRPGAAHHPRPGRHLHPRHPGRLGGGGAARGARRPGCRAGGAAGVGVGDRGGRQGALRAAGLRAGAGGRAPAPAAVGRCRVFAAGRRGDAGDRAAGDPRDVS
jgi:hypothetical protein